MFTSHVHLRSIRTLVLGLCSVVSGCAVSSQTAFDEVRHTVHQGMDQPLHWNLGSPEDAEVEAQIDSILKEPLTPKSAITVALLNNRRLQSIFEDLGIARAHALQATLLPNPVLSGDYKQSINGGGGPEIEFSVLVNFLDLLTLPARRKIAKEDFEAVKSEVARQVFSLAAEVQGQFFSVQADGQELEMLRQIEEATAVSVDAARRLFEAGNVRDLELANEEAMHSRAKLDLAAAELKARKERERLNILMGLWGPRTAIVIPARLPDVPESELDGAEIERQAVAANLELEAIEHRIAAARRKVGMTRATALFPQFELGGAFKREPDGNRLFGPGGMIPIPLFDQGQPRVTEAEAEYRRLQAMYHYKSVEIRAAARASWDHLRLARDRALYTRNVELPLNHRILEQSQLEYNAMQMGVFQLLMAKQGEIEAGRRYIDDLLDYWLARTEVESIQRGHVTEFGMQTTALDSVIGSPLH